MFVVLMLLLVFIMLLIPWMVIGAMDGLTHGGLFKNKTWQITRKILWRNKN